mgnify:FL=1
MDDQSLWKINSGIFCSGGGPSTTKIGNLTKNECFVEGTFSANPWEGDDAPVFFLNSSHQMTFGLLADYENNLVDFTAYASNGTSWVSVNTLERKVQYATVAYYADGSKCCNLPAGSKVWLTSNGTAGATHSNYIAVTSVETASGKKYNFFGNPYRYLINCLEFQVSFSLTFYFISVFRYT